MRKKCVGFLSNTLLPYGPPLDPQNDTSSQAFLKTYVYSPKKQSKTFKENL